MIEIERWVGRLGNNILQVLNAVYFAELMNVKSIRLPEHSLFISPYITLGENLQVDLKANEPFFCHHFLSLDGLDCSAPTMRDLGAVSRKIKRQFMPRKIFEDKMEKFSFNDKNTVFCHVRAGDIFSKKPLPHYIQPPLYFYEKVFKCFARIIVVTEDMKNPVLRPLARCPDVSIRTSSILKDFQLLVGAQNVCMSNSTFSLAALLMSDTVSCVFIPSFLNDFWSVGECLPEGSLEVINCPNYIKIGEWKNSWFQRRMMLKYTP